MDAKESNSRDNLGKLTLAVHVHSFVESVGFQGVRYVFMKNAFWLRRLIWSLLLLTATGYLLYVTVINVQNFFTYPTATKSEVHYVNKLQFPAVTVCNYNIFQRYRLSNEQISMLEDMYEPYPVFVNETGKDPLRYNHVDMRQLILNSSFSYQGHLGLCTYKGQTCNASYLPEQLRDIGNCMTFDPRRLSNDEEKYQTVPEQSDGFSLGLAFYEGNWTHGPFMNYQGFSLTIHDPSTNVVLLQDTGIPIAIGHTTNVIISNKEINLLPPPHGQCGEKQLEYYSEYTEEACLLECRTKNMIRACGCRLYYMPGSDSVRFCNNINILYCQAQLRMTGTTCDCPPRCSSLKYETSHTVTAITNGTRTYTIENFFGFDLRTTAAVVNVYYGSLSYKKETQEATYSIERLLGDVGGACGLFLGASFMSICEVLDFLAYIIYLLSARAQSKKSRNRRTGPEN